MRFSIATLLLVTMLVAAYFPLKILFEPWQRSRIASQHPLYATQIQLSQLRNGDSTEVASGIFPALSFVEPDSDDLVKLEKMAIMLGKPIPKNADFYRYNSHGLDGMLMFRNGKLVKPDHSDDPVSIKQQRLITPSLWFRSGILPAYTLIASITILAWVVARRRYKSPSNNAINTGREPT